MNPTETDDLLARVTTALGEAQTVAEHHAAGTGFRDGATKVIRMVQAAITPPEPEDPRPQCGSCQRRRTFRDEAHPMDAYDYNPMQVLTGQPLGWYSGDDGQVCPECMTKMIRG